MTEPGATPEQHAATEPTVSGEPAVPDAPTVPDGPTVPGEPTASGEPTVPGEPTASDEPAEPAVPEREPRSMRGAAIVGARVVAGAVGIGVAAVAILVAALVPLPGIHQPPPGVVVTPVPSAQQLVCPGALLRLGDETGQDATTAVPVGAAQTTFDATTGTVETVPLTGVADAGTTVGVSPVLLRSPPTDSAGKQVALSGAQTQSLSGAELAGLATAGCAALATDTWLVGGSTAVGRTTLVMLANPSDVVATVALDIFGESGLVTAPGTSGITVQPHSQRVLSLAGFAPDLESPVVHVSSRGGQIMAVMQQSTIRGLDAGGVDFIGATLRPATTQVIPGLEIVNGIAVQKSLAGEGYDDVVTALRVFVPGQDLTGVQVAVVPTDAAGTGTTFSLELAGGRVTDIPLEELADGGYTVSVTASHEVVAGVRVSTASQGAAGLAPASDFAWLAAAEPFTGSVIVTVVDGPRPRLYAANRGDAAAELTVTPIGGETVTLVVPAGSGAFLDVAPGTGYVLSGAAELYAAIRLSGDGQIAGYGIRPPAAALHPLTIFP